LQFFKFPTMKKFLLCLSILCSQALAAQQILDIGIFNHPVNSDKLEVRIKPTETVVNGAYTAGVFTVRHLSSYGITLSAPTALNNPLHRFGIANQGTDGTYSYYSLSFVSPFTVNWNAGIEYPIAILQINAGCGVGDGVFEIINNAWTFDNNGHVYQELNGNESQNIIYQPSAIAPLGVGVSDTIPPTVVCTSDKTVNTDLNRCYYTHLDPNWDAIGSDNCPGFVLQYLLSGATVDTLFTLDDAAFNKGITQINVTVTDIAGQTANCAFAVTVNDNQAPSITAPPAVLTAANAAACSASGVLLGTPLAADNCPNFQVTNNAPAIFPLGNTTVTWTITDDAGLSATATQNVQVQSSLLATAINLSAQEICSASPANLSFSISGGVGAYTLVYSANAINNTVTDYSNNQAIAVTPSITTIYNLVSLTDSLGCVVSPTTLLDTLVVVPSPTLSSLLPSASQACPGDFVAFTATGLLPNQSTTFNFTLQPGGASTLTGTSSPTGTFTFPAASQLPGVYGMSIQSITTNGCSANFSTGNQGTYTVNPFPSIASITATDSVTCSGAPVQILANGLPPDVSATIQYTLNGVPGSVTVVAISNGTAILLTEIYPEGNYEVVVQSVSVGGCALSTNVSTTFSVDPFQPICGFTVAGKVTTDEGEAVESVLVTIRGISNNVPFLYTHITDTSGTYRFNNTVPLASDYGVYAYKNDNPLNGVTTFDLVLISKHILGTEPILSPYRIIAADANKSNSVTTFDIVELRKLILGIYDKLPNNDSWRFVDKSHMFPNISNPFVPQIPDTLRETNLQMSALAEDLIAIKVGDINGSVSLGAKAMDTERTVHKTLLLKLESPASARTLIEGDVFTVSFIPQETVAGYQFTLEIQDLEVLDLHPGDGMHTDHFGVFESAVTGSFVSSSPEQKGAFSITFRAKKTGLLNQMLAVSNRITPSEAYAAYPAMERMDLQIAWEEAITQSRSFELFQNQPNPFSTNTQIPFYLPEAGQVRLSVFNELGNLMLSHQQYFESGPNAFELNAANIPLGGLLFYKVESTSGAAVRKMTRHSLLR
jgi:hypothetical protein